MTSAAKHAAALTSVQVGTASLDRFAEVLSPEQYEEMRARIAEARRGLVGRTVWNVNSTVRGGGVAELLNSILAYARGEEVDARWRVIEGDERFFGITKRIHNRLHGFAGDGGPLGEEVWGCCNDCSERSVGVSVGGDGLVNGLAPVVRRLPGELSACSTPCPEVGLPMNRGLAALGSGRKSIMRALGGAMLMPRVDVAETTANPPQPSRQT